MNLHFSSWLLLGIPILLLMELLRRRFSIQQSVPLEKTGPSRRMERCAETILLSGVCLVIWLFTATNSSTGGRLLHLEQLPAALARVHLMAAVLCLMLLGVGLVVSLRWSVSWGTIGCILVMIAYATLLNGPGNLLDEFVSEQARQPHTMLTFDFGVSDLKGAELYVNGVRLGKLPLTVDQADFLKKVPVWDRKPQDDPDFSKFPEYFMEYSDPFGSYSPKACFLYQPFYISLSHSSRSDRKYYAQLKYQGQWCYWTGHGGSGGGRGEGRYIWERGYPMNFLCPTRELQIETLLNQARLQGYQVSETWFEAMQSLGRDGLVALLKAEPRETGITTLLHQWASYRYGLDAVQDEASAWQVFEKLCREVHGVQAYSTEGLEGRAVTWLAPMLPIDKLTRLALRLIDQTDLISWTQWRAHGRMQFGYSYDGARMTRTEDGMSFQRGGVSADQCPIEAYPVAHALWIKFKQGDREAVAALQDRIVPAMMAKFYDHLPGLPFLCAIGGSKLEHFLLRQNWQAEGDDVPWNENTHVNGRDVNGWFWMLIHLDTAAGRQFRQRYLDRCLDLADEVSSYPDFEGLEFLFLDSGSDANSLAMQYWPRFKERFNGSGAFRAEPLLEYLMAMEPNTPASLYVDTLLENSKTVSDFGYAYGLLKRLPPERKEKIYRALREFYQGDLSHLDLQHWDEKGARDYLMRGLNNYFAPEHLQAQELYKQITQGKDMKTILKWLQYTRPDHELVAVLALSDRPDLRCQALLIIAGYPSKRNRELLQALCNDLNDTVRQAAVEVKQQWQELAQESPMEVIALDSGEDL